MLVLFFIRIPCNDLKMCALFNFFLLKNFSFSTFSVFLYLSYDREGEVNGIHYHFTDVENMEKSLNNGEFLEYAKVHGNYYGTSRKSVEEVRFQILN